MVRRFAAVTLLRGDGECNAFYNSERDKVVEAVKAEMERQKAQARTVEDSRNRLLAEKLDAYRLALAKRSGVLHRLANRIGDAWALFAGTVIVWGEALGLLVYVMGDWE